MVSRRPTLFAAAAFLREDTEPVVAIGPRIVARQVKVRRQLSEVPEALVMG